MDVEQDKLDGTRAALDDARLTNVELMLSEQKKLPIEAECLDGALMAKVLHHAEDREALLEDTGRCLKKSGWVAVVENYEGEHGVNIDEVLAMSANLGFRFPSRRDLDGVQYLVTMRK